MKTTIKPQKSLTESLLLRRTFIMMYLILLVVLAYIMVREWMHPLMQRDMYYYWQACRHVYDGILPYWNYSNYSPHDVPKGYIYAPSLAVLIAPLSKLSYICFVRIWYILLILAAIWYARCLSILAFKHSRVHSVLAILVVLMFLPIDALQVWREGQVEILIWALMGTALTSRWEGVALAAAVILKPYSIWAIGFAGARQGWRFIVSPLIIWIIAFLIGASVWGAGSYLAWIKAVSPLSQGTFWSGNISLPFSVLRLLKWIGLWHYEAGALGIAPHIFLIIAAVSGPLIIGWITRKLSVKLQISCVVSAGVLFSPICWLGYLPICLAPLAILYGEKR